jgi:hypothetical protein
VEPCLHALLWHGAWPLGYLRGRGRSGVAGAMRQNVREASGNGDGAVTFGQAQVSEIQRLKPLHVDLRDSCNTR